MHFDCSGPGPNFTLFGEIKDPYVRKLKVINQNGEQVPVKTFTVDQEKKRIWYAMIDPSRGKKFQIVGLGKDGKPITTQHYSVKTNSSSNLSSTVAFTPAEAVKKIIARHPDFPSQPNQTKTVRKPTGRTSRQLCQRCTNNFGFKRRHQDVYRNFHERLARIKQTERM